MERSSVEVRPVGLDLAGRDDRVREPVKSGEVGPASFGGPGGNANCVGHTGTSAGPNSRMSRRREGIASSHDTTNLATGPIASTALYEFGMGGGGSSVSLRADRAELVRGGREIDRRAGARLPVGVELLAEVGQERGLKLSRPLRAPS